MRDFSLATFALKLVELDAKTLLTMHAGLKAVAQHVEKEAKDEIGQYQPEVGQFPAWAPLAESTVEDRIAQGYSPDEPLLREGTLRDSITHEVHALEAVVGSTSPIAAFQEFGTEKIPPRPFIGPAAFKSKEFIEHVVGVATITGIGGRETLPAELTQAVKP